MNATTKIKVLILGCLLVVVATLLVIGAIADESGGQGIDIITFLTIHLFTHFNMYIGGAAVIFLALGTILYEIDNQRFTRLHGYLAIVAFGLTTLNVILIIPAASAEFTGDIADPSSIDWLHLLHMLMGITGYAFGILAMFTGLGGLRTRKPGYIALFFWACNFVLGVMPQPLGWGLMA